ncbi:hypothetical protein HNR23_003869 [Nocardiopsis mwathae]|uniref:DUF397 domain-containing protein n=1 Tax=Nocardiopsis mwathae TaxID=1472723 RepID=A0A7X0D8A6_9ACTN|nr:hypothetical protein [Nocardiopsis mwathae]
MTLRVPEAGWRKSSYSNAGGACVEVAHLPPDFRKSSHSTAQQNCLEVAQVRAHFRKSSHSGTGNNCIEVADLGIATAVRDSMHRGLGHLAFGAGEWSAFLQIVKAGGLGR